MSQHIVLALLGAIQPLTAQECANAASQMEMTACAAQDYERADGELNAAWPRVVASARADDREVDLRYDRRPGSEAKLREAQRAWIVFRDAHCTVEGYDQARGGSMEPMVYDGCRARLTRERIRQLTEIDEPGQ